MHVIELYQITEWIDVEIRENEIVQKYQNLQSILQQNAQPNQQQQSFESQKNELIEALGKVALNRLSIDQLDFLKRLKIAQHIGDEGINSIEDNLYKNVIDIATSASNLQNVIEDINYGLEKSEQIQRGLEDCVDLESPEFDEVLIRVNFSGSATMANVTDLKNWGIVWYDIARGIAMAHGASPEEVKVVGAKKGSIIIELAVVYGIAHTTSKIILSALNVADRVLDIRKKAEELRGLKLSNKKLANEIEKEADKEKESGIANITKEIVAELQLKIEGEGDKVTALDKSVHNLVDFIEKGGEVDFVMPEESDIEDEDIETDKKKQKKLKELRLAFEGIRRLEHKIKQIEQKNP